VHNAEGRQARKKEDIDEVSAMFQKNLEVGVKMGDKPCLIKITVDSEESKVSILRNCNKLRDNNIPQNLAEVFITPDLTPKERQHNKSLRNELAELNKDGSTG